MLALKGADPNQRGYRGTTPLHKAAGTAYSHDHAIRVLTELIDAQADVNAQDDQGATALMEAVHTQRPAVVQFLLDHGADASLTDCKGQTALDIARPVHADSVFEFGNQTVVLR